MPTKMNIGQFILKRIMAMSHIKSATDIAKEIGYERPIKLSAFIYGETKVPLDKAPSLAKALDVDVSQFFRLALKQYWPNVDEVIEEISIRLVAPTDGSERQATKDVATVAEIEHPRDDEEGGQGVDEPCAEGSTFNADLNFKVAPAFHHRFVVEAARRGLTLKELMIASFEATVAQG